MGKPMSRVACLEWVMGIIDLNIIVNSYNCYAIAIWNIACKKGLIINVGEESS